MKQSALKNIESRNHVSKGSISLVVALMILTMPTSGSGFHGPDARIAETHTIAQESKPTDVRELKLGEPIERELAGSAAHSYRVSLTQRQYLKVVVEQKGIDVVVRLFGPDGKQITEVDSPNGTQGPEPVSVIADAAGEYRLEVKSLEEKAKPGRYEVKIAEMREATAGDRDRITAEWALAEAEQLRAQGTGKSLPNAVQKYEEALLLLRKMKNTQGEAKTLSRIGTTYLLMGDNQKALEFSNQALPLWRAIGDQAEEANTLGVIGSAYDSLGQYHEAIEYRNQGLALLRATGNRQQEAIILNDIGISHYNLGEWQKALEHYNQALSLARAIRDRRAEANTLVSIGALYWQLEEHQKALEYYNQALTLARATGDRDRESLTLHNIGRAYQSLNERQKALEYYNQTLSLVRAAGIRQGEAATLHNMGTLYESLGDSAKALDFLNQALTLRRAMGDRHGEGFTLSWIGEVYLSLKKPDEALNYLEQALSLIRAVDDRLNESSILHVIARAERNRGRLDVARSQIEKAINIVESMRSDFIGEDLRISFSATIRLYYDTYANILMQMHQKAPLAGHDLTAFSVNERTRALSLLEMLTEARVDIRKGVDAALLDRARAAQQQLNASSERLTRLLAGKHTEEQEVTARKEVEAVLADYQNFQAEIRAKSPRYAALTQLQPLTLKEIQQLLDRDTILLEYALGKERSFLWAVTPTSIKSFELPKRADIEAQARRVHELLVSKTDSLHPEALTGLSQTLLGPVADQLGNKRLLIVSHGALQHVPFGALPAPPTRPAISPGRRSVTNQNRSFPPLIVNHEIVSLPSASVLAVLRRDLSNRALAPKKLAILADPVFQEDDQRIKRGGKAAPATDGDTTANKNGGALKSDIQRSASDLEIASFDRLLVSRREADVITARMPKGQFLKALDFAANRETAKSPELGQYQIVHFATHSLINNQHPELSGIVLSLVDESGKPQDGFLRLHEIYNLKLGADLVVLSACQTALGKDIRGEGLIGLTRGFMYAGAPRVVASLWKVSDAATAELMSRFYQNMLGKRLSAAASLRAAQLSMRQERQWAAPYYWAGFVLQGEWR